MTERGQPNFNPDYKAGSGPDAVEDFVPEEKVVAEPTLEVETASESPPNENEAIELAEQAVVQASNTAEKTNHLPVLAREEMIEVSLAADQLKRESRWAAPALFNGNKTATEYDSTVGNFSTKTRIVELSDGKKIFLVYNYPASSIHRSMDNLMKRMTGCKMSKSSSANWKKTFEARTRIATLSIEDPNTVLLPYIPNVNAYDLFANRKQIENFGVCTFANEAEVGDLLKILEEVTRQLEGIHDEGVTWGELILPNIIVDKNAKPHICDPETQYDENVPVLEQKARDLMDLIVSTASALNQNEDVAYEDTVSHVMGVYGNQEVLQELGNLAKQKPKLLHRLFFGYTKARLGVDSQKSLKEIKQAIISFVHDSAK